MQAHIRKTQAPPALALGIRRRSAFFAIACILACTITIVYAALAAPPAWAKDYTMPQTTIDAIVGDDGSLDVTETRTFKLNGDFTCVWWEFGSFGYGTEMSVQSVKLVQGGINRNLNEVEFVERWRSSGGPGDYAYSVDDLLNGVYVFFEAENETISVELHYRVDGMAAKYSDVGELYWKFVGSKWAVTSRDVTMTLHLPQPAGTNVVAGDDVRAWAHGPLDGDISFEDDGSITFTVPRIDPGTYAEAHVVFPTDWIAADANVQSWNYSALSSIVDQEQEWADEANQQRAATNAFYIGFFVVFAVFLAVCLALFMRFGREHKTDFTEQYWRDVPDRNVHPLVVKYVESWGSISTSDFATELMHLTASGALYLGTGAYSKPVSDVSGAYKKASSMLFGDQAMQQRITPDGLISVEDYYLAKLPKANELTDPIDLAALNLLFGQIGGGADSIWFDSIDLYAKKDKKLAVKGFELWTDVVKTQAKAGHYIEKPGKAIGRTLKVIAFILAVISLYLGSLNPIFYSGTVIAIGSWIFILRFMPRRSRAGAELHAKANALENWLNDFTLLNERLPLDVKTWGEFMVYATLFGIAKKVMDELRIALPDVYREATETGSPSVGASNWGLWMTDTHHVGSSVSSLNAVSAFDAFTTTVSSSFSTSSSDGGGGGGGFSGGGGGGGGGGGAR